ncbi:MAG: hypothetical protein ACR2FU_14995 [Streptosporangiaceae bacterium]
MSYRVQFGGRILGQLHGLPGEAFDALVARAVDLVETPWDATVLPPGDDPAYRETVFGGAGLLRFYVDDDAELIEIFGLIWIG